MAPEWAQQTADAAWSASVRCQPYLKTWLAGNARRKTPVENPWISANADGGYHVGEGPSSGHYDFCAPLTKETAANLRSLKEAFLKNFIENLWYLF